MKTVTCKFPEKLNAELTAVAREEGATKSEMVRKAVEKLVGQRRKRRAPRAFDLVGHLSGCLKGPKDLSTNPKYMKGFGA